jgi:hypothetical protein
VSATSEWNPRISRNMVRGPSSFALLAWILWGTGIGLALLVVLVVGMLVRGAGYGGSPFLATVMAAILLDAVFLNCVVIWVQVKKRREARAGYATVMNERQDLDQIDPATGRVVRLAGEPFLGRAEHSRRIAMIRAARETGPPEPAGGVDSLSDP